MATVALPIQKDDMVPKSNNPTQSIKDSECLPADVNMKGNYVSYMLKHQKTLPPVTWANFLENLKWDVVLVLAFTPLLGLIGACYTRLRWETAIWAVLYYQMTAIGMTAGYHRLWSHRSYNASKPLQYALALLGASAAQGHIWWWARGHRAHHRYTDTDLDPYSAHRGLLWSHIGWLVFKPRRKLGIVDASDLEKDDIVQWQRRHYPLLMVITTLVFPTVVAGLGWGDWMGGCVYASLLRLALAHQSFFCVNSLAHWLGEAPFDDKHTPRDHWITALITLGEGYHNFHHQFPMDYRSATKWYQYDPTKWLIWLCGKIGLASNLKTFSENEIRKGKLTMKLKYLHKIQGQLSWPSVSGELPVMNWENYQTQANTRPLLCIAGFIHDISDFLDEHPGGRPILQSQVGRDATHAFFGGVYDHSNAANNLLAMRRVGILQDASHGLQEPSQNIPPSQRFRVVRYDESSYSTPNLLSFSD